MTERDVTPEQDEHRHPSTRAEWHRSAHDLEREAHRVESRAHLLPEEESVGSDDPETQAAIILEDSLERTEVPNAAPTTHLERRGADERLP